MRGGRIVERDAGRPQAPVRSARTPRAERASARGPQTPAIVEIRHADVFRARLTCCIRSTGRSARANIRPSPAQTFGEEHVRLGRRGTLAPVYGARSCATGKAAPSTFGTLRKTSRTSPRNGKSPSTSTIGRGHRALGLCLERGLFHNRMRRSANVPPTLIADLGLEPLRERPFMQLSFASGGKC